MKDTRAGQIRLGSPFGDWLYTRCLKDPSIRTVVEIGAWRGLGSTECFKKYKSNVFDFLIF